MWGCGAWQSMGAILMANLPEVIAAHTAYTKMEAAAAEALASAWARVVEADASPPPVRWHGWGFRDFLSCPKDHVAVLASMVSARGGCQR
jgi:hypothetical protein